MSKIFGPLVDSLVTEGISGKYVQKRIGSIRAVDAFAGKRIADRHEALIVEVRTRELAGVKEWPSSRGFDVLPEPVVGGPEGRTRIHLQLAEKRYRQVFRALCEDVCDVLRQSSGEEDGFHVFRRRLVHWQSFLQKHGFEGLDDLERCGLFGELFVLRDLLLPLIDATAALRAWRGCKKADQDFQFPDRALEVKATRATIPDKISVSNVQQLDDEDMEHMFLIVVHLNENETTGETLPGLVETMLGSLPDDARDLLESGLEEVGYSDAHRDLYSRTRYQPLALKHFEVREGFPRLTRDQIPDGVKSVQYAVNIDACGPFGVDQATVVRTLRDGIE